MLDSFILLAAATAETAAEPGFFDKIGLGGFGLDGKLILAQMVNFVVVAFLLWRFAFKPVMATLDERQNKIAEGLQFAEEAKTQLAETEKRQAEVLREANTKAQEILHEARDKARELEDRLKAETSTQIDEMRKRAEESNELERQKMLTEVRQEIARLVVMTSGKVLQRELGDEEKARLDKAAAAEISQLN
ncbi:MAG: F0F1 ATP synthase subunit B [Puniceicoccaceae bacterium]